MVVLPSNEVSGHVLLAFPWARTASHTAPSPGSADQSCGAMSHVHPPACDLGTLWALLFGRYAFPANRLGYCGPDDHPALELREGKLALTEPQVKRITRQIEGHGFADGAQVGDFASIHWSWVCEVLDASALRRLMANMRRYLALANQTL
jgi:hypothetical protein